MATLQNPGGRTGPGPGPDRALASDRGSEWLRSAPGCSRPTWTPDRRHSGVGGFRSHLRRASGGPDRRHSGVGGFRSHLRRAFGGGTPECGGLRSHLRGAPEGVRLRSRTPESLRSGGLRSAAGSGATSGGGRRATGSGVEPRSASGGGAPECGGLRSHLRGGAEGNRLRSRPRRASGVGGSGVRWAPASPPESDGGDPEGIKRRSRKCESKRGTLTHTHTHTQAHQTLRTPSHSLTTWK